MGRVLGEISYNNVTELFSARIPLFPVTAGSREINGAATLHVAGLSLQALAEEYGTPLYVYDQQTMDDNLIDYRQALAREYPGASSITYAGKAFLNLAMAQWVRSQGLMLDCTGAGEIHIAHAAGLPRSQVLVHGVSKSRADLESALAFAGTIVVDNLPELFFLASLNWPENKRPEIWLRLRPGIAVDTHHHRQTGQEDSKFGMSFAEGMEAVRTAQVHSLPLTGIHFHQGSHFHDPSPVAPALHSILDWIVEARSSTGWQARAICPGGGWGVPYHESDLPHRPVADYVQLVAATLQAVCRENNLPLPVLHLEPGRSLVARAGLAVYCVNAVKNTATRRWLLMDGGMADNPRVALYGARYSALPVASPERPSAGPAWMAGPYCESGDVLIENLNMPAIQAGELIAVPVSGAYQLSMGSNYNGARRPAVVWVKDGRACLVQARESLDDLLRRDLSLI